MSRQLWLLALGAVVAAATFLDGVAAQAAPAVVIRGGCSPTVMRPNEPTVVTCDFEVENTGDAAIPEAAVAVGAAIDLAPPKRFFFFEPAGNPINSPPPSISLGTFRPGEVRQAHAVVLLEHDRPGTFGGAVVVYQQPKGPQYAQANIEFEARPDASDPLRSLKIGVTTDPPISYDDPTGEPFADATITVRNESEQTVRDIRLRDTTEAVPAVNWDGSPTVSQRTPPAFAPWTTFEWHIDQLAPGEERTFHGRIAKGSPCQMSTQAVLASGVEASGRSLMAGDVAQWSYRMCSCPTVDCIPPTVGPTITPTPVASPTAVAPAPQAAAGGFRWWWGAIGGGAVFLAVGLVWRRRR